MASDKSINNAKYSSYIDVTDLKIDDFSGCITYFNISVDNELSVIGMISG